MVAGRVVFLALFSNQIGSICMAQERPSWSEIDKRRDRSGGRQKRRQEKKNELQQHSTRYDRYKADLDRLFDQGLAGELLKKVGKQADSPAAKAGVNSKASAAVVTKPKRTGRIPADNRATASRLKLMRSIIDAGDASELKLALDELVERFGLPDDWGVLIRVLEHNDEKLALEAIGKMSKLLPGTAKIPRRFSLKERLRTIGQTAYDVELRKQAESLEERL
jgi:hypothetical protein